MYAEENKNKLHVWSKPMTAKGKPCQDDASAGRVLHLASFYVAVGLNFVVHFLTLIISLMMLRYDENRDYELVAVV